jgi:hypothetical protein
MNDTSYCAPRLFAKGSLVTRTLAGVSATTAEHNNLSTNHTDTVPTAETAGDTA